jgi:(R,R)-butanediol dehydrogenase / meso-butanediol dehydrogenase / diacetyl reductase
VQLAVTQLDSADPPPHFRTPYSPPQNILFGEKVVTASCCFLGQDMKEVVAALADGLIKVDDLITSRIALKDIVAKGLHALVEEQHHVKILVDHEQS